MEKSEDIFALGAFDRISFRPAQEVGMVQATLLNSERESKPKRQAILLDRLLLQESVDGLRQIVFTKVSIMKVILRNIGSTKEHDCVCFHQVRADVEHLRLCFKRPFPVQFDLGNLAKILQRYLKRKRR